MGRGGSAREDSRPTKTEGGLGDSSRAGSQTADAQSRRDALIAATLQTKPQGMSHWSCRTMAQAQGVSKNTVNRLWQLHNLKPHLSQTFKLSRDPKFVEKLTDVVGLYLNPPQQALVLCVEEKSQIQALDRTQCTAAKAMTLADQDTRIFLKSAPAIFVKLYGESFSVAWEQTGFPNQSTAVPRTQAERMDLCASLQKYFVKNPTHENAGLEVTAAAAQAHFDAMKAGLDGIATGATDAGEAKAARDAALEALKTRMRGLIGELATLLGEDDPRWHAFGLNKPGEEPTPEVPENLVLTAGTAGKVLADWGDTRNADHYRGWVKIVGVDKDFRHVFSRDESDGTIPDLPSGATVQVRVTAVNEEGDESLPSEVQEIVVP